MVKKLMKSLMIGIIVFSVAVLVGYLSYVLTYHYAVQKTSRTITPTEDAVSAEPVYQEEKELDPSKAVPVEYYMARFDGTHIGIYTCAEGKESFLYNLDVYIGDLPKEDLEKLREGIRLEDRQALASFEEDYTS